MKKTVAKGRVVAIERSGKIIHAFQAKKKVVIESPDIITDYAESKAPAEVKEKMKKGSSMKTIHS